MRAPLRFVPYHQLGGAPNVVVDGSATEGTTLALSHWPGTPVPPGFEADLSIQMALAYLDHWDLHGDATAVSNNHFDQDGLTSTFVFVDPQGASERATFLADVGAAGDFATYADRSAARVTMAIAAYADHDLTPLPSPSDDYEEWCGVLYEELLGRLPEMCDHPERYRSLWEDEDATLAASEAVVQSGAVEIEEIPMLDLALVTVPADAPSAGGHRFASQWASGLHPMALNNATSQFAIATIRGASYEFTYRYESWVQYRSSRPRSRVDLGPLADELNDGETSGGRWVAEPPGGLTPRLYLSGSEGSSLHHTDFCLRLEHHLATAPPAWDPYQPTR